jgi:xylulokinase
MHGLVALDECDRVIRPAILWNDQRTAAECEEIERRIGVERLIALTGNRALTGFTAPKLLWLRAHEPGAYSRIRHVLLPKDYVRLRLTGERATDVADASGTLLFDVAERSWSAEVLEALELPPEWLPAALESPEVSGQSENGTRLPREPGTRPPARWGSASPGRGRSRWFSARRGSSSRRCPRTRRSRKRASTSSATPSPEPGTRWA